VFSGHGLDLGLNDVGPGQQVVDLAVGAAVYDPGEHVGELAERFNGIELQVSISDATTAQCSAPASDPAKSTFLRERSTPLLSI
jgi:hypothetical protein